MKRLQLLIFLEAIFNPLSANLTKIVKHTQATRLKQFVGNSRLIA